MMKENLHFDSQSYQVVRASSVFLLKNLKKLWKHLPVARVPTAFLVLPNFHLCFYNSIETQYMFSTVFLK